MSKMGLLGAIRFSLALVSLTQVISFFFMLKPVKLNYGYTLDEIFSMVLIE